MIDGNVPILTRWNLPCEPPWSTPAIHRLFFEDFQFSNAIDLASWQDDLAWLWACEGCGGPECSRRGVARMRRLGDQLLWMRVRDEDFPEHEAALSIEKQGVIPRQAWEGLRLRGFPLPDLESFQPLRRRDLARLWLGDMPERARVEDFTALDRLLRWEVAATHPLDPETTLEKVRRLARWFLDSPEEIVPGDIHRREPPEGLQTCFFDRTGYPEWSPFAASDSWTLAFEGGFLLELPSCR